ncbi:MAG: HAMP domain-containing histidine kinase [Oscillospiraceae bacterium]|jgi:signal transduction histidine kinase|nr:HAMP domain-containing histidine kinase [Oscillospiraceae bacterium]
MAKKADRARHTVRGYVSVGLTIIALFSAGALAFVVAEIAKNNYTLVRSELERRLNVYTLESFFLANAGANGELLEQTALDYVNHFPAKDIMEIWILDSKGRIVVSSSGFGVPMGPGNAMEDLSDALGDPSRRALKKGRYNGEHIYACSYILNSPNVRQCAVRLLVSLKAIDLQIAQLALMALLGWLAMNLLLFWFGRLLVRWVGEPLAKVSAAAAKIAEGNYTVRIELPKERNEIYDLSENINYMAEKVAFAEQTKLDFISTISHELRTPLTAIRGWGETLALDSNRDWAFTNRGLSVMIDETARLTKLVEELLDFSRLQSNRLQLNKEYIDVLAELDDVVFLFRERAAREGVELVCSTSELPAPMYGDPARIRQVFVNLLDNAFKHTPQGGSVSITGTFSENGEVSPAELPEKLCVAIQDTGPGVPEAALPHLTEKFFKADIGSKGSGIGLAVVAELLKAHGCELRFENAPTGRGLLVKIMFPLSGSKKQRK